MMHFLVTCTCRSLCFQVAEVPEDGVMINGMFLDGASWNDEKMLLAEARPGEMFANVPVVHFEPAQNHECPDTKYSCPCYKTSVRAGELSTTGMSTNFVLCVELPTDCPAKKWILQGECCERAALGKKTTTLS